MSEKATLHSTMKSPVGDLLLLGDGGRLSGVRFLGGHRGGAIPSGSRRADEPFQAARAQLAEYFAGARREFDLRLAMAGTPLQLRVWKELESIPYGQTISYGELARRVGDPATPRAVGAINGQNPIAIIVPCHRVIGADGALVGYGGGLPSKRLLLDLETYGPEKGLC